MNRRKTKQNNKTPLTKQENKPLSISTKGWEVGEREGGGSGKKRPEMSEATRVDEKPFS